MSQYMLHTMSPGQLAEYINPVVDGPYNPTAPPPPPPNPNPDRGRPQQPSTPSAPKTKPPKD